MKKVVLTLAAILAILVPSPALAATWRSCAVGDDGYEASAAGTLARFTTLRARVPMNCASARYVLNRWIRPAWARRERIPYDFHDGYVDWSCFRRGYLRWQCDEYESGTAFRFTAYTIGA